MSPPAADATATRTNSSLDQLVDVETPEHVVLSYTVAGVGSRAAAALIDYLICLGTLLLLFLIVTFAVGALPGGTQRMVAVRAGSWFFALFVLAQFAVLWGYYVLFEGLADGQTPGKKRLGLRVVQDGGYSVGFAASAVRNIARVIDMQPGFVYGVGIIAAAVSRSGKRIGDMLAGTIVVRERVQQLAPVAPGRPAGAAPITALLTDEEYGLLERYMGRRQTLEAERRRAIADQLVARFASRVPHEPPSPGMLVKLYEHEQAARARGVAARSDTGAAREQHAIVALGTERWSAFATTVADVQRRGGLRALSEKEVVEFVARYRETTTDLARLKTASRGRELDALFYLSRLVASGHNLLYRQRRLALRNMWRYVAATVPAEIRRSAVPILLAGLAFFGPMAIAYVSVMQRPARVHDFIAPAMIDRAENGAVRRSQSAGYIDDPQLFRPVMATSIIANNVQVTFAVFAFGMTAGILTLALLVMNGVQIGGIVGLYQSKGVADLLFAFLAPHGVLELAAITIAGGAGLLVASAILLPGTMTRREALVVRGRRAIRLIAGSTMLLLAAGLLEGFVSPIPWWPLEWKLFVALVTFLLLLLYLTRGRGANPDESFEENAYLAGGGVEGLGPRAAR
jgi:uncharacterized membrane protein SpoIIM required for sporulation/uncharacterized RDD family membrane protein YckC